MSILVNHNFEIRQETSNDVAKVYDLVKESFRTEQYSDHKEHDLVDRLRKSSHFIPELSLVAVLNENIIGYILLTLAGIKMYDSVRPTLSLAPVAVHPKHQKRGIGAGLMKYAHHMAEKLGYESIVVIGHQDYYPKFGYKHAQEFGIRFPFDVPEVNSFVLELREGALNGIAGEVVYAKEFFAG
jgi:predicted N-acetyltransferase YhbS